MRKETRSIVFKWLFGGLLIVIVILSAAFFVSNQKKLADWEYTTSKLLFANSAISDRDFAKADLLCKEVENYCWKRIKANHNLFYQILTTKNLITWSAKIEANEILDKHEKTDKNLKRLEVLIKLLPKWGEMDLIAKIQKYYPELIGESNCGNCGAGATVGR